jgi:asparagine synthase (glutamine-hydrolysing)
VWALFWPPDAWGTDSMCGVAGVVGDFDGERSRAKVLTMMTCLCRRGPDGEGLNQWPSATLGHRRLAIFDLTSSGHQPMLSPDGQVGVVFNGAIYNFLGLREELEREGIQFRSRTDTEVLVHGYPQWGVDGLVARLRGMFAIAIWDNQRRKLFLIRDRLGVKPLLYSLEGNIIAFASTARALHRGGMASGLNTAALAEFLEFGFITDKQSIFSAVKKVLPGQIIEWDGEKLTSRTYWSLPRQTQGHGLDFEDVIHDTEQILQEAVKIRLQADVPVGALLSGGIDSSLVCWAAASVGANVKTFTVSTPGDDTDEAADAAETARYLGIPHSVIRLSADEPPDITDLISAYGEPFSCASALGMLKVSRAVKQDVTVLLTGDGGDDIFLGYPYHRHFLMAQQSAKWIPASFSRSWPQWRRFLPENGVFRRAKHFLDYANGGLGAVIQAHDGLPLYRRFGLLGDRIKKAEVPQRQIPWSAESARHLLEEFLIYDWQTTFTGEYLTKVDGGTMYHALEARSPFLDHVLWEYAGSLPFTTRLRNGELKAVLREIARRHMGPIVANRRKRGFEIPVCRWLANQWGRTFLEMFADSLLAKEHFVNAGPVLKLWRESATKGRVPVQLWHLFVLESWMRAEFS